MEEGPTTRRAAVLLLCTDPAVAQQLGSALEGGVVVVSHSLTPPALESDRSALAELGPVLAALAADPRVDGERIAAVGFGRGGTLAFLLGCTRELAAVVDVGGPVLHAELSPQRPTQPLELALNFGGAFLGLFARGGSVGGEELEHLRQRLGSAARPCEILLHEEPEGFFDPGRSGYDGLRVRELMEPACTFLREHLAPEPD